ncbi:MAG: 4-hydroxyphenylpyruvate dioxygenase [Deltaproteobacteria bacterium]|nr:MAG: 4-hydroxyphenylpyruvate dioxygenase [Deltaproteobacteria bacterium]
MSTVEPLGILAVHSLHYYVRDLDRMRTFLTERMDFAEVGGSSKAMEARGDQRSAVFEAGDIRIVVSAPLSERCRAARWLRKHPEGVGTINFEVRDADKAFSLLDSRGGTFLHDVEEHPTFDGGSLRFFSITTPFGDTTFRFLQRQGTEAPYPGYEPYPEPRGGQNKFGFDRIDHITSNFQTMRPMLLWMEHVMGFEVYWDVAFHTIDVDPDQQSGSGLKSVVVWDPGSQVKFANNEPARPFFKQSQINLFHEDLRGEGVQHAALTVANIQQTVRGLRGMGVEFMPTPGTYYDMLPERLERLGIGAINEDLDELRELQILVDGEEKGKYMLQIFLKEQAGLFDDPEAGPFFIEIIERKGDKGFGAGNFRALFESIERKQREDGRI